MSILKSDKAPFILVVLLGMIGWLVSQLVTEVKSDRSALSYSLVRQEAAISVDIWNESHDRSVNRAELSLVCMGRNADCLVPMRGDRGQPFYGYLLSLPPAGARFHEMGTNPDTIYMIATLPPGAHVRMWGTLKDPARDVNLFFTPDQNRPQDVYIYDRNTIRGFVTQNLVLLLAISLAGCVSLLVAYLWKSGALRTKRTPTETG